MTERPELPHYYRLSDKVKWVNFDINFDVLDTIPLYKKIWKYWWKQRQFKKKLTAFMMDIRPDITVSVCHREINFITEIKDGSKKIAEIHFARTFYRNFDKKYLPHSINSLISRIWINSLVKKLEKMDRFIVLTDEDRKNWQELKNTIVIPNFISFIPSVKSVGDFKRVISVGRYSHEKGFDLLLKVWSLVEKKYPDWIENCLPSMTSQQQKQVLHQLVKQANEDSRKEAILDPLSRIPRA